jgi:hypothetical protein
LSLSFIGRLWEGPSHPTFKMILKPRLLRFDLKHGLVYKVDRLTRSLADFANRNQPSLSMA